MINLSIKEEAKELISQKEKDGVLELTIKDNSKKLGHILNFLPHGIIDKTVTGIGATTLEIKSQRNSIIVVPLKIIAASKVEQHPQNSYYVGSPINNFKTFNREEFEGFLSNKDIIHKNIIVVAESLKKVINIIGERVYKDFFLMIDEINSIQEDSKFRETIENCLDYYFKFPEQSRAMITATMISFSHPELKSERKIVITYATKEKRTINKLITTFNSLGVCIDEILNSIKNNPNQKIVVAYNSVRGSKRLAKKLVEIDSDLKSKISILCSKNNAENVTPFYNELEKDTYPNLINFITSAYFSGYDINEKYNLISVINREEINTRLSFNTLKQIAGRAREGLYSETIICPCIFQSFLKEEITINSLIKAAESEIKSLECIKKHLESFTFLSETLDNIREAIVQKGNLYGYKLVRKNINYEYVISYFNIDSFIENRRVAQTEHSDIAGFIFYLDRNEVLKEINQFVDSNYILEKEDISENTEIKKHLIEEAIEKLTNITDHELRVLISSTSNKEQKLLYDKYSKVEKFFINKRILLEKLRLLSDFNLLKFRNFRLSVAYKSLPEDSNLRIQAEGIFKLNQTYSPDYIFKNMPTICALFNLDISIVNSNQAINLLNCFLEIKKVRNTIENNGYKILSYSKSSFEDKDKILEHVLIRDEGNPFMHW